MAHPSFRDPRFAPAASESADGPRSAAPGPPPGPAEQLRPPVRDPAGYLTPNQRYAVDVEFATLVNFLESLIATVKYTPTELREACLLAATRHELRNPRPIRVLLPEGGFATERGLCRAEDLLGKYPDPPAPLPVIGGGPVDAAEDAVAEVVRFAARDRDAVAAESRLRQKATDDGPR